MLLQAGSHGMLMLSLYVGSTASYYEFTTAAPGAAERETDEMWQSRGVSCCGGGEHMLLSHLRINGPPLLE